MPQLRFTLRFPVLLFLALSWTLPNCGAMAEEAAAPGVRRPVSRGTPVKQIRYAAPISPIEDKSSPVQESVKLSGSVEHSESLLPLDSQLKVGSTYDEKKIEKPARVREWYKVPPWLAGTWESHEQTTTFVEDYGSGQQSSAKSTVSNHGVAHYGKQRDKAGGLWDLLDVPIQVESKTEAFIYKDLTTKQSILQSTSSQLVLKDVFTRRKLQKSSKKIVEINQTEQISTIRPAGKNKIKIYASMKTFDSRGKKLRLLEATVTYIRKAPFRELDFKKNSHEDLRSSFYWYLQSHGKSQLIPPRD